VFHRDDNLVSLLKKSRGFDKVLLNSFYRRLEYKNPQKNLFNNNVRWCVGQRFLLKIIPKRSSYSSKHLINAFILDLITTYKGWRHTRGLPVRGQRTWSNGWNASRLNTIFKDLRIKKGRKMYGNLSSSETYTAQLAEHINLTWKNQWFDEWDAAKTQRLKSTAHRNVIKTDLYSMAQGNIMSPVKFDKLSKKQQQRHNKNHFSLGFEPGFTRPLLKELYEMKISGKKFSKKSSVILHKSDSSFKKKGLKKKK